jgi:hypothetical protein
MEQYTTFVSSKKAKHSAECLIGYFSYPNASQETMKCLVFNKH